MRRQQTLELLVFGRILGEQEQPAHSHPTLDRLGLQVQAAHAEVADPEVALVDDPCPGALITAEPDDRATV